MEIMLLYETAATAPNMKLILLRDSAGLSHLGQENNSEMP
jgi:hypothetical protein